MGADDSDLSDADDSDLLDADYSDLLDADDSDLSDADDSDLLDADDSDLSDLWDGGLGLDSVDFLGAVGQPWENGTLSRWIFWGTQLLWRGHERCVYCITGKNTHNEVWWGS